MPARDIRDLQNTPEAAVAPTAATPPILPPIQLQVSADLQRTAVELVLSDFESAKADRSTRDFGWTAKGEKLGFDDWLKQLKDLYFGRRIPKTLPWRFASNRSLMIAMAILEVMHARIFPAVYNEELTRWRPGEVTDQDKAERIEHLMFWWVRVHVKLREFFDRWCRLVIGFGFALTETVWDVQLVDKGQQTTPQNTMNPDGTMTVQLSEKVLDRIEKTRSDLIAPEDVFLQPGASDIQRDSVIIRRKYLYRELQELERNGATVNISQPSETGVPILKDVTPVPVAPSAGSSLTPEGQEELLDIKRRNLPIECLEWYGGIDLDGDGFPEQVRLLVNAPHRLYLGGVALSTLSARGMRHLDLTMYMPRLDEPQGLFGLGVLEQVKELALEIDAIFNQLTDANSLTVLRPGFYDPSGDLDPSAMNLAPNKLTPVTRPQESLYFPQIDIPTERLILAVRLVLEFIERLTAASSYILGKESEIVGGSGTATRTEAIVGAANQRFGVPTERLREGAARIMTHHLDLVQTNLPPGMEQRVLGEKGEPVFAENVLTREGIAGEFDAYLLPDEAMGSKEAERQLAQLLYQVALGNPIIMSDMSKLYKVTSDLYKAFGKDPEQYLGIAPDVKQTDRPEDENTMMLQGDFASVKASILDNPIEHLMSHEALPNSPVFQMLPPELQNQVQLFNQAHIQEHMQMFQLALAAATQAKRGGMVNAPAATNGASRRKPGPPPTVGPEPGLGSVANPAAQARSQQRVGEGSVPA